MKKRYIISYSSILTFGYVQLNLWPVSNHGKKVQHQSVHEAKQFATKFRWKWLANLYRWIMEHNDEYMLMKFKVIEHEV